MKFTVAPVLIAMMLAIVHMPTDIYQICRREVGTLEIEPWRMGTLNAMGRRLASFAGRVRNWLRLGGPIALVAACLLLALVLSSHLDHSSSGVSLAMAVPVGLKALRQRAADIQKDIQAIADAVAGRGADASMTDEERTKLKSLKQAKLDNVELLAEAEATNEADRTAAPVLDPDAEASRRAQTGVTTGRDLTDDDPKRGFKNARDFFTAVMHAGMGRGRTDPRLTKLRSKPVATQGSDEQGEYDNRYGGFFVPHAVVPGVLSIAPETDPIAALCTPVPMEAPTVSFNARTDKDHSSSVSGGFRVYRRAETVDGQASRAAFEQVTLTANEEFGVVFASERLLTDSPVSFLAIVQSGMGAEYVANGMNERINGTGTGERQGILKTPCKISVAKETGQAAATIVKENIDKMAARCWRYGRSVWLANHNTRPQLKSLVQVVGVGGAPVPYFLTTGAPDGFDGVLDGRPLLFTEFAKTVGTEGDLMVVTPSEYLDGTYQTEQFAESMHVRFVAAERAFRFYRRNDGQWWWKSALTPNQGSTLSPVVTLATRS